MCLLYVCSLYILGHTDSRKCVISCLCNPPAYSVPSITELQKMCKSWKLLDCTHFQAPIHDLGFCWDCGHLTRSLLREPAEERAFSGWPLPMKLFFFKEKKKVLKMFLSFPFRDLQNFFQSIWLKFLMKTNWRFVWSASYFIHKVDDFKYLFTLQMTFFVCSSTWHIECSIPRPVFGLAWGG